MTEKRKRQANFSANEKFDLFSIIHSKYAKIIENKTTDKVSMSEKELAWQNICEDFNASSQGGLFRDKDSLKRFYENRKREVRKLKGLQRQERLKTGGGPETKIIFDIADELLIEIMNIKTIEGLLNSFDSDEHNTYSTNKDKTEKINNYSQNIMVKSIVDCDGYEDNSEILMKRFKKADDLRKPKDPALRPLYLNTQEKPDSSIGNNLIYLECEGKEYVLNDNHSLDLSVSETKEKFIMPVDPDTTPLMNDQPSISSAANNMSGEQQKENVDTEAVHTNEILKSPSSKEQIKKPKPIKNRNKIVTNTRPHRTGIKILASSHIAKKYDELLDQRKILLQKQIEIANQDLLFQKAKQKLELELITLKVMKEKKEKN